MQVYFYKLMITITKVFTNAVDLQNIVHNLCSIQKLTQHPTKGQSGQALSVNKKLVFHGSC